MRIIRLEVKGFKSFAREEVFEFHDGVTAIVGPNGCGKSNVVDAVRWVLGEQSRKDLRMKASTDVIFGGTANRAAAKYATVTITFDNADGTVPGLGSEFSITRKLTASGDSEYLINGQEAKLRQLKDVFTGTGVGPGGYTIMEQGKIDALLSANPEARRKVFEEASGIALYRQQRAATEQRLEVVAQNLERLTDRINEARNRLKTIKGAASRALKYREYTARLRVVKTQLSLRQFHESSTQREELLLAINDAGREEGKVQKALSACLMDVEAVAGRLHAGEQELTEARRQVHQCELTLQASEGQAREARARAEGLRRSSERLTADLERAKGQLDGLRVRLEELSATRKSMSDKLADSDARLTQAQAASDAVEKEASDGDARLRTLRASHMDGLRERGNLISEKSGIEGDVRGAGAARVRVERRRDELAEEFKQLEAGAAKALKALEKQTTVLDALKKDHEQSESGVREWNTTLAARRSAHHALQLRLSGTESRIAHLSDLERMLEGVEKGSRALMSDKKLRERCGVVGLVCEIFKADIKVAPALETALGTLASAVIVDTSENAFDALDVLARREGAAATVIVRSHFGTGDTPAVAAKNAAKRFPKGQGVLGPLLDEVKISADNRGMAQALLGNWLLVADRDVARRVEEKHPGEFCLVTPTGESYGNGRASMPSSDRTGGVITQRSELARLREEQVKLAAEAGTLAEEIESGVSEVKALSERAANLRGEIYDASVAVLESKSAVANFRKRMDGVKAEQDANQRETAELEAAGERQAKRLREIADRIAALGTKIQSMEDEIAALAERRRVLEDARAEAGKALSDRRVEAAEFRASLRAVEQAATDLKSTIAEFEKRITDDHKGITDAAREVSRLEADAKRLEDSRAGLQTRREQQAQAADALALEIAAVRADAERLRGQERTHAEAKLAVRDKIAGLRRDEERLFGVMNGLRERLLADFDADLDAAYRDYDPNRDTVNPKELAAEAEVIQKSLKNLGPVSMEAVDELEEVENRHNALTKQEKDLVRAKKALESAIERIETEARRRYIATFESVRTHFQRLFRKMFGGGSADIILLNPENVLESGVEIMAKPPGMEPKTISLLSGGQRTMIAVAMLFALFETAKAPFGLLDEVDAALDEANVDRFCTVLREYAARSQFVVITHHKKTMSNADRLYGVTMQEPGISKKVSVDLNAIDGGGSSGNTRIAASAELEAAAA